MASTNDLRELILPVVAELGLRLFDLEHTGSKVVITVDSDEGVDLEQITAVNRAVAHVLDEADPIADRYTLEVSSPGLERPLRDPAQFVWAVGQKVTVRTTGEHDGERRYTGELLAADDDGIRIRPDGPKGSAGGEPLELPYGHIQRARTVFEWEGEPKPTGKRTRRDEAEPVEDTPGPEEKVKHV